MRVGIGVVAGGPQLFSAELAVATGDGEGNNDPVAAAEVRDFFTRFLGDADEFVSQDVAFFHGGNEAIEQMQVRPANRCPGYLNYGIVRIEDRGIGNVVNLNVAGAHPAERFHRWPPALTAAWFAPGGTATFSPYIDLFILGTVPAWAVRLPRGPWDLSCFCESFKIAKVFDDGLFRVAAN